MVPFPYQRIVVIGTTASGKSTLAKKIAEKIQGDDVELDALYWESNWVQAPFELFRERVIQATKSQVWVAAGNYHSVRDVVWGKADLIIWLDYPFHVVFYRLLVRTMHRIIYQEELWNGNRESFWMQLKIWSEDSLFHWLFKTYWRRKREIPELLSQEGNAHLKVLQFQTPGEAELWLANIPSTPSNPSP